MPTPNHPHEERLAGGFINEVVRVGNTVRRAGSLNTEFVARLLQHLDECHWNGAPRFLGIDEQGGEILSFIEGIVRLDRDIPAAFSTDQSLIAVTRLVREFHDLTAGTSLAGTEEVVCHNDLSPKNTVYRGDAEIMMPVAFIDWDLLRREAASTTSPRSAGSTSILGHPSPIWTSVPARFTSSATPTGLRVSAV